MSVFWCDSNIKFKDEGVLWIPHYEGESIMTQGLYKNGEAIEVTYQATAAQTGLNDVKMDVYDEGHALDAGKSVAAMTEIGATGRYYAEFTPDAEGKWTVLIDSITKPGKVVKKYAVGGHNVDSVGDAVAGLNDISSGDVDTALATYDAPTKAELDTGLAALNDVSAADVNAQCDTALTDYDAATGAEVAALNDISTGDIDARLAAYDAPTKAELDAVQGGDGDTLETLSDQLDSVASADSAPMVG